MGRLSIPVALLLLVVAVPVRAGWNRLVGEEAPPLEIESWVAAPDGSSLEDLRGRVVLLLLSGGAEDHVLRWNDIRATYWEKGLRIIRLLAEAPADPDALMGEVGVESSVAVGGHAAYGDGDGARAVLIGANGEVEWEGKPGDLDEGELAGLLRRTKEFHLPEVAPDAESAATAFEKGDLAEARELARELLRAEGTAEDVIADAAHIDARVAALLGYWSRQIEKAKSHGNYAEAAECAERIRKHFSGAEEGNSAKDTLDALEDEPGFRDEVSACKQYRRFRTDFVRAGDSERKTAALVKKLERYLDRHSGTRSAERIGRLLDSIRGDPAIRAIEAFIAREKISTRGASWRESLPKPPKVEFAKGRSYFWTLKTNKGSMVLRLLPDQAPMHVSSTIYLTRLGFYDGLTFHRVIPGFMAQGGCPKGTGTGGPGYTYEGEHGGPVKHSQAGILSMANTGQPSSDGSQFFITFKPTPSLDGKHTVFGILVSGEDTLRALEKAGTKSGTPTEKLTIEKATVTVK